MTIQKIKNANPYNNAGANNSANKFGVSQKLNINFPTPVRFVDSYDFADEKAKFVKVTATTGSPIVVAAIPGKKIRVVDYVIISSSAQGAKWQSNTTDISGNLTMDANGGAGATSEEGLFETATGEALRLLPDGAGTVSGHITYWIR